MIMITTKPTMMVIYLYVFFDVTLLPVFYANREPFGKMLTLIDFAFEKKKKKIIIVIGEAFVK